MKLKILTILFVLIGIKSFGQCSAIYHNIDFITSNGDTINQTNNQGFYIGKHIYADNDQLKITDSTSYIIGHYDKGKPIGLWTNHCENRSFSIGHYNSGIEVTSDEKKGWSEKEQGIYAKIGEWKYYNSDSTLVKIETYERFFNKKGWTDKTYLKVNGENILIEYNFKNKHNLNSIFYVCTNVTYRSDKSIKTKSKNNFFKNIIVLYYPNGQIKRLHKCKKILGFKLNKSITHEYSEIGEIINKKKGRCWTTIE